MNLEKDFNQIYKTHAPKVFRLCMGYAAGDQELAQEWQQQTFIKVWQHRKAFKGHAAIGTWIYKIAINTCLADLRKPNKKMAWQDTYVQPNVDNATAENEKREKEIQKMYRCISLLSPANKAIILLQLEKIPQATIAKTQGLNYGALRTRLNRIRKTLLKFITNEKR